MLSGNNTWPASLCQLTLGEVVGMWRSEAPGFFSSSSGSSFFFSLLMEWDG